ncbi:MAG: O-antigen ligase family protein [Verrucomicrobiota bacterium]|nr:O-antigen ligase family protein [Verrucomicrobiota bacterium]
MDSRSRWPGFVEGFSLLLFFAAFAAIHVLIGGTRLVFSLPSYIAIGVAGSILLFCLRTAKPAPCRVCLIVTALAFAYLLGRAVFSPVPYIARSDLYMMLACLVVYFAFSLILTANTGRMLFMIGLLLLGMIDVGIGAIQFRDGNNFMLISWLQRYDYGARASGFYVCPNHLAGMLEVVGVIALSIACWSRWPLWAKLLIGYVAAIAYVGIVLTGSRGGYLSAGASLLTFAILSLIVLRHTTAKLFWKVFVVGAVIAVIGGVAVTAAVSRSHYLANRAQTVIDTENIRRDLWDAALRQWHVSPIIGTGSATYLYYGRFFRNSGMQRDPVYVHNDYLHLLAEYGIIGVAAIALVIGFHARRGLRSFARLGAKRVAVAEKIFSNGLALNIGALCAVAAYSVHEALDFNLHIPANAILLAFVFAILANDGVVRDRGALQVSPTDTMWRVALGGLAILLGVQSARMLPGEYFAERARTAVRDNQPALAIRNVTRGLDYDPQNPDLYYHLGDARVQLAEGFDDAAAASSFYAGAIDAFTQARSIAPQEVTYALELASTLDSAQRFPEAEWIFEEALQLDPKSETLRGYYNGHLELWGRYTGDPAPETTRTFDDKMR